MLILGLGQQGGSVFWYAIRHFLGGFPVRSTG